MVYLGAIITDHMMFKTPATALAEISCKVSHIADQATFEVYHQRMLVLVAHLMDSVLCYRLNDMPAYMTS